MSTTGLEVFDTTLQKTTVWLNDVMYELGWEDERPRAYLALRTVLHALRDRLTVEEAMHLGAQLPMLIRGFYYEGWTLSDTRRSSSLISSTPSGTTNGWIPNRSPEASFVC